MSECPRVEGNKLTIFSNEPLIPFIENPIPVRPLTIITS